MRLHQHEECGDWLACAVERLRVKERRYFLPRDEQLERAPGQQLWLRDERLCLCPADARRELQWLGLGEGLPVGETSRGPQE
ncbi:hypothetical protein [Mumia zhuanghuii]|uniref:Uncharacterized protein n=1 Tax=Mumia zhuanghuii TaxID=2585211 RepID=A0A5C4MC69_9ACTN|nr:hypothetical protein [Mumia zhuanghuii]TNC33509.1 hypothetical protein FHE65_28890 [Mumia zhuanghuii]